jgi:hypothetical protein
MTATRLWQTTVVEEKGNAFGIWSSPLIHEERLYLVDGQAKGLVLDLAGGQILGKFSPLAHARGKPVVYASLCLAAGRIFVGSEAKGVFSLVEPGPEPKVAAASEPLGDTLYSTPCFVAGRMYVRTHGAVFCIGFP